MNWVSALAVALALATGSPRTPRERLTRLQVPARAGSPPAAGNKAPRAARSEGGRGDRGRGRRPSRPADGFPDALALDLIAAAMSGGVPVDAVVSRVASAVRTVDPARADEWDRCAAFMRGADPAEGWTPDSREVTTRRLVEVLRLAQDTGLAPSGLVRGEAMRARERERFVLARRARRLEVLLVLPTGLCLLPAFVLLGVVPVVLSLFAGIPQL